MTALIFALMVLATWRITHLVVEDTIPVIAKPRDWVIARKPEGNLAYLLGCTYCSSVWVAAGVVAAVDLGTDYPVPLPALMIASLSILAALGESILEWLEA